MKAVPRQRRNRHAVPFEKLLKMASSAGRLRLDRAMDEEIDPRSLAQPAIDVLNPLFQEGLIKLPVRMTDEADKAERRCNAGLQREFGLAPLHTHLQIIRTVVNRAAIQQHSANAEAFQNSRQTTGVRFVEPVRVADFQSQRGFAARPSTEKSGEVIQ